jgi:hypothetical protein
LKTISAGQRQKWDVVVLQSWRDDYDGEKSAYIEYAPIFAELVKAHGAVVVLYETAPLTQNAEPLLTPPDREAVLNKEKHIAEMARRIDATVVPMPMVAMQCQTERPDFTLRYINDGHPNQTMAYLAACTFYSALFGKSPEGLPLDRVKDTRHLEGNPMLDQNGDSIEKVFSDRDRADLQRIVWAALNEYHQIFNKP